MAAATTAAIMLCSDKENKSPWAALNCVAHIVDGDEKEQPVNYSPRESGLGVAVNGTAMCAWGVLYEGALSVTGARRTVLTALLGTGTAYVIDYYVVPKQFTPGIEKRLSGRALLICYGALCASLAVSGLWHDTSETNDTGDADGDI